ncbi:MAG: hypothetical protein LIO42_06335, partial [Oscillospiraceae bacterium]|nr:hypothetical protein [Oscillospiraceae bacterium]
MPVAFIPKTSSCISSLIPSRANIRQSPQAADRRRIPAPPLGKRLQTLPAQVQPRRFLKKAACRPFFHKIRLNPQRRLDIVSAGLLSLFSRHIVVSFGNP